MNNDTTTYYWLNGSLEGQKTGEEYLLFLHDESGTIYGFVVKNGTAESTYYYDFNLQGDVVAIIDMAGNKVVEYTYDVWGVPLSITGTLADTIGQKNPIRYRGYYYDNETGFYYLQSRYYDPEIGRFINADGYVFTGQGVLGYNMFAYCGNNPVNFLDNNGMLFQEIQLVVKNICTQIKNIIKVNTKKLTDVLAITNDNRLTMSETTRNAKLVYNYLQLEGWSHNAICATLGNMQHESYINAGKHQISGPAFGLVQWDPATKYLNWASGKGYSKNSMTGQLEFLMASMEPAAGEWFPNSSTSGYYMSSSQFVVSTEPVEYLTKVFLYSYERAGHPAVDQRIQYACYWDSYFRSW